MDLLTPLPGAAALLAAHAGSLPQPDQLCGPWAAWVGLHALLPAPPPLESLALAAGTRVWPHDVADWRPPGAPLDRTAWSSLRAAASADESGTTAAGVAAAITALSDVAVVPVRGGPGVPELLAGLVTLDVPVGVLANVRTGPLGLAWDVGHFVVLHAVGAGCVGVADSYRELGAPGQPAGCRVVPLDALVDALTAPPGRGLLLLVDPAYTAVVGDLVDRAGLVSQLWST